LCHGLEARFVLVGVEARGDPPGLRRCPFPRLPTASPELTPAARRSAAR
jgi:hypothetical protein